MHRLPGFHLYSGLLYMEDKNVNHLIPVQFKKSAGYSLLVGSFIAVLTAMLHPVGGDIGHIVHVKCMLFQSHTLAIICLPIIGFGFFCISRVLLTKSNLSILALIISFFGLIAGMFAATINGLTLPAFAANYAAHKDDQDTVRMIVTYGKYINIPMAYILITAITIAIAIWSWLITRSKQMSAWTGYFGLFITALGIIALIGQFDFTSLFGFRTFLIGLAVWKIVAGFSLISSASISKINLA